MAGTKVFISSTCYDLSILRAELRNFVLSLGHEPVMSEYADVLYDPRIHTHTSCVNEVSNCDMMVVIIGSRFGGASVPQALDSIDSAMLQELSKDPSFITQDKPISITQLEVLKAIESNIPIYTFVEKKVYYEHKCMRRIRINIIILFFTQKFQIFSIVFPPYTLVTFFLPNKPVGLKSKIRIRMINAMAFL